jgi:hypothetical protein
MDDIIKLPYLYFMDTTDLSEHCPVLGQTNITHFDIVYDDSNVVSIIYKPADIPGCTRSIVFFSQAKNKVEEDRFFSRIGWKHNEAHIFYVSDPFYLANFMGGKKFDVCGGYYMMDFKGYVPLIQPVLVKFHELLGIAFCKLIGTGDAAYSVLQFGALFDEIAPWTLTLAMNPPLVAGLLSNVAAIEKLNNGSIDWSINYSKIKAKVAKGKHLFFVVQNNMDSLYHKDSYLKSKSLLRDNGIQGWTFQTPASTFYNSDLTDHHSIGLSREAVFDFIDWMSYRTPDSEAISAVYNLKREF